MPHLLGPLQGLDLQGSGSEMAMAGERPRISAVCVSNVRKYSVPCRMPHLLGPLQGSFRFLHVVHFSGSLAVFMLGAARRTKT